MEHAIREGACIVTDTQMAKSGINRQQNECNCLLSEIFMIK